MKTREEFSNSLMRAKFRVKIKSLAAESRIIRDEMRRRKTHVYTSTGMWSYSEHVAGSLDSHRRLVVRHEQRHTLLAYAMLRGKPYSTVERSCIEAPKCGDIARIVKSLTWRVVSLEEVKAWLEHAKAEAA